METIIASAITGAVTLIICIVTNHAQAEKTRALIDYRIQQLEKKQDKHNSVIERTYKLEQKTEDIDERVKNLEVR